MTKKALKMFVWRDVLRDYTGGIAVAMAYDESGARDVLLRDAQDYERETLGGDIAGPAHEVYDAPHGVCVWGGG